VYNFFSFLIRPVKQRNCNIGELIYLWTNVRANLLLAFSFHIRICTVVCMLHFLPRDAMHKRGLSRHVVSVSVCVSVCLSRSWILWKRINISSKRFSPSDSHIILVFCTKRHGNIPTENPLTVTVAPNAGEWGRQKSRFWAYIWLHRELSTLRPARCHQHGAAGPRQVVTLRW